MNFEWDFSTTMGEAWLSKNDPRHALEWLERAATLDRTRSLPGAGTAAGRTARAGTCERLALAYAALGDRGRAIANDATALELDPGNVGAREQYATLLAVSGSTEQAVTEFQRAGWTRQRAAAQLLRTAGAYEERANSEELHRYLVAAAELSPAYEPAVVGAIRFEIMSGNLEAAKSRLDAAARNGVDRYVVAAHRAWLLAASGDRAGAQRLLLSIPEQVRMRDPRVAGTIDLIRTAAR